jgi:hypothetical protein
MTMPVINGFAAPASARVIDKGQPAAAVQSKPQASQIAGEGAKETGESGKKQPPKESTPALAGSSEVQTTGTTAEEQRKKLAASMYPSTVARAT